MRILRPRLTRPWLGASYLGLGLVIALTSSPGWYVYDARFEHYWAPQRFLARHLEIWDGARTLGRPTLFFSPGVGAVLAVFDRLGASPALTERLLHGCYLGLAGLAMVEVLRLYRPRLGPEHAVAGVLYVCNPFTTQFLVPSGLYLHAAISPLLVVAAVRGARGPDVWRWAAMFALLVAGLGAVNSASLLYAALPAVPALVHALLIERDASLRSIAAWIWRAATLSVGTCAAALFVLRASLPVIAENLGTTELPRLVSSRSSWAESWRGLGGWQSYVRLGGGALRPGSSSYFTSAPVVLSTYAIPVVAVIALWRSSWRGRSAFALIGLVSLCAMVGIHPVGNPPPLGSLIETAFDRSLSARSLRNGYKAGPGLMMFTSAVGAVGVVDAVRFLSRRRERTFLWARRAVAVSVAVLVIGLASNPFWTGELYSRRDRAAGLPTYWSEALDWLSNQPDEGRALILPGVNRARYTWGFVGDDIFDALLDRDHVSRSSLAQGTPLAADLIVALDEAVARGNYRAGAMQEVARRTGIRYVVVRNDLDWRALRAPAPSALAGLRSDPDLRRAAVFGRPGQNLLRPDRDGAGVLLPPVEVYEVRGDAPQGVRVESPSGALVVAGDGEGFVALAGLGWLRGRGPVRYSGALDAGELRAAVEAGAEIVITDSNRRRVVRATSTRNELSETLDRTASPERAPRDLFRRPGSQTTVLRETGADITASLTGGGLTAFEPGARAALAFDGSEASGWVVRGAGAGIGDWVRVDLDRSAPVGRVEIVAAVAAGGRRVTQVSLTLADGTARPVQLANGRGAADFDGRRSTSIEIRIDGVEGDGVGPLGIAEVMIADLDLTEEIVLPDDLFRVAPDVARAATTSYVFERARRAGGGDEEVRVRRSFVSAGARTVNIVGTLQADSGTPEDNLRAVVAAGLTGDSEAPEGTPAGCIPLIELDGELVSVALTGSGRDLVAGRAVPFSSCGSLRLTSGVHRLATLPLVDGMVADVTVVDARSSSPALPGQRGEVVEWSTDRSQARGVIEAPDGGFIILNQAHDRGWWATIDGTAQRAIALDGMAGWSVAPGRHTVSVEYRPQRAFELALVLSAAMTGWCAWLLLDRRRRPAVLGALGSAVVAAQPPATTDSRRRSTLLSVVGAGLGYALAGGPGALLGLAAGPLARVHRGGLVVMTTIGLGATAVASLVESPLSADRINTFVADRPITGDLGRLTGVLFASAVVALLLDDRRRVARGQPSTSRARTRFRTTAATGWEHRWRGAVSAAVPGVVVGGVLGRLDLCLAVLAVGVVVGMVAALSRQLATHSGQAPGVRGEVLTGSMWVMGGFIVQAASGLVFWLLAARLHPASTIGAATALFSSMQFINYATNLGVQDLLSRFHVARHSSSDSLLGWSVLLGTATSLLATIAYVLVAPTGVTNAIAGVGLGWGTAVLAVLAAGAALVAAVDARLMAARRWRLVFWRLSLIGVARLPLLALPSPDDAGVWIFAVMAGPIAVSGYLGLAFVTRSSKTRLALRPRPSSSEVRFAGGAWLTNILVLSPQFALPVVVLAHVEAAAYAAFFLAWTIVAVVTIVPVATSKVLLAEGTRLGRPTGHQTLVGLMVGVGAAVLATLGTVILHPLVVVLYGSSYSRVADLLPPLCLGAVPWAVTTVLLGRARLRQDTRSTLITTSVMAFAVVGGALLLAPARGVDGAVLAWILGSSLSAATALLLEWSASDPLRRSPSEVDSRSDAEAAVSVGS